MSEEIKGIAVNALVDSIRTIREGGYKITIDISEMDLKVAQELLEMKSKNQIIKVVFMEITGEE